NVDGDWAKATGLGSRLQTKTEMLMMPVTLRLREIATRCITTSKPIFMLGAFEGSRPRLSMQAISLPGLFSSRCLSVEPRLNVRTFPRPQSCTSSKKKSLARNLNYDRQVPGIERKKRQGRLKTLRRTVE
ncbi:MAG: hypothetical protein CV081_00645, partial [Nitrospira sp. LK265]|nr:hypothetical protein [Nitrospira sp. LK265]